MSLYHRLSGNESYTPNITDLNFPLKFCIPFSSKFLQCIHDGPNPYCVLFHYFFYVGIQSLIIEDMSLCLDAAKLQSVQ